VQPKPKKQVGLNGYDGILCKLDRTLTQTSVCSSSEFANRG